MFCRNCGSQVDPNAAVCIKCGYQMGMGQKYCLNCGAETMPGAAFCIKCGMQLSPQYSNYGPEQKSKIAAGVLGIVLGAFGVHNFYLGYTGKAVAQLLITVLTLGICSFVSAIWGIVEGILILTGSINVDANGVPLRD